MGYPEDRTRKSIKKTLLAGPWRFILNMAIHCMGSCKGGFDEANLTLASGVLAFTQGKMFNWSSMILQGMRYNLEEVGTQHNHL